MQATDGAEEHAYEACVLAVSTLSAPGGLLVEAAGAGGTVEHAFRAREPVVGGGHVASVGARAVVACACGSEVHAVRGGVRRRARRCCS